MGLTRYVGSSLLGGGLHNRSMSLLSNIQRVSLARAKTEVNVVPLSKASCGSSRVTARLLMLLI